MFILAESVSFAQAGAGLGVVVLLMGALLLFLNLKDKLVPKSEGTKEVKVGPLPFPVQMADRFATKEELHEVKQELRELEKALPETERRILTAIEHQGDKIEETVNKMASVATEGRRKLHDKTLLHTEQIAKLETKTENTAQDLQRFKSEF